MPLKQIDENTSRDFDFEIGDWKVKHRKLKSLFTGCNEWLAFEGLSSTRKILGGLGNLEENWLNLPSGAYRAAAIRTFDKASNNWSIWWLDGRFPGALDVPVVGSFSEGVGRFFAEDVIADRPVKVRFLWYKDNPQSPRWEQAFSENGGETWETNWVMEFHRI